MRQSKRKEIARGRARKPSAGTKYHRPTLAEIRQATEEAVKVARAQTDEDIERAIKNDPDSAELDVERAVVVRPGEIDVARIVRPSEIDVARIVRPGEIDVARIRSGLGLTQAGFAAATGIPHRLVSDWEQGRKKPSAAARALLLLVDAFGEKALKQLARRTAA